MGYRLKIGEEAEVDMTIAVLWYVEEYPGREEKFVQAIEDCVAFILRAPLGPARFHRQLRQFPLKAFPYFVVYMVEGDLVTVLRVFHMRRDPRTKIPRRRKR